MFKNFARVDDKRHITGAPYHPTTNGLAETLVQSFKHAVKADKSNGTVQHKIDRFLLSYRAAPHSTTGVSPAQLLFQRNLKVRLDLIKRNLNRQVDDKLLINKEKSMSSFHEDESVWIRNYRNGPKWVRGSIVEQTGPVLYRVKTDDKVWRRHLEQLRGNCSTQSPHSELSDNAGQGTAVADGHVPATTQDLPGDQDSFPADISEMTAAVQTPPLP